jgi:pimeloyl-ACP methyl ester carboxylesterase
MNAQGMTNAAPYVGHYAQSLGVERAVVFNYRGVGGSRGSPTCASDLVDDTVAMIRYLETAHGVNSSLLLIHGQSLGATVAVPAAARAKSRGPVVSDRGFSSLHDIALSRLKQPLFSAFFGSALSMLSFGSMMQAAHAGQYTRVLGLAKPWLVTQVRASGLERGNTLFFGSPLTHLSLSLSSPVCRSSPLAAAPSLRPSA